MLLCKSTEISNISIIIYIPANNSHRKVTLGVHASVGYGSFSLSLLCVGVWGCVCVCLSVTTFSAILFIFCYNDSNKLCMVCLF